MKKHRWSVVILVWSWTFPIAGHAHLRNYLDTYGYDTLEKGHTEMELWTDRRNPDSGRSFWFHQTEVEYGVTDRYSLGLYGVFVDGQGFSAFKAENRYRLAEHGEGPVDTALYLEFKKANGNKDADEIEGKVILSKDIGAWNFTVNPILELERETEAGGEKEWETETALAVGTAYKTEGRVTPGVELFLAEHKSRITPGVYIDVLPEIRLNVGAGIGLEKQADDVRFKSILEIEF